MTRMESSINGGIVFDIKEMIIRDSFTVAVRVGLVKGGKVFQDVHQFLFLFNNGKAIVGVKESTGEVPLTEMFD
jgi:hypothetical protein